MNLNAERRRRPRGGLKKMDKKWTNFSGAPKKRLVGSQPEVLNNKDLIPVVVNFSGL